MIFRAFYLIETKTNNQAQNIILSPLLFLARLTKMPLQKCKSDGRAG